MPGRDGVDGKVLRRLFDRASGKSALHMVSAWGCEQRMVLAQIATGAKSNEITRCRLFCIGPVHGCGSHVQNIPLRTPQNVPLTTDDGASRKVRTSDRPSHTRRTSAQRPLSGVALIPGRDVTIADYFVCLL
jgi:hypothetical protein